MPAAQNSRLPMDDLTSILNGHGDFGRIKSLTGFIDKDKALKKSSDTKTALVRMDETGTNWFPVVERNALLGIVERSALTASLVLDVVNTLSGSARSRG